MGSTPRPEEAFVAAALVLLVMPLLVVTGLTALSLVAATGILNRIIDGYAPIVLLVAFIVWVLLVVMAILALISRLTRRFTRS